MVKEPKSEYFTTNKEDIEEIITDPVEYEKTAVFMVPEKANWDYILKNAQADN
jgi:type I restriction enzyme M protein